MALWGLFIIIGFILGGLGVGTGIWIAIRTFQREESYIAQTPREWITGKPEVHPPYAPTDYDLAAEEAQEEGRDTLNEPGSDLPPYR